MRHMRAGSVGSILATATLAGSWAGPVEAVPSLALVRVALRTPSKTVRVRHSAKRRTARVPRTSRPPSGRVCLEQEHLPRPARDCNRAVPGGGASLNHLGAGLTHSA